MNIFKFEIHVQSKEKIIDIKSSVINSYQEKSKQNIDYKLYVKNKWKEIKKENVKALYSEEAIVTYSSVSRCEYSLVEIDNNDSIEQISFDVIVISKIENISISLDLIMRDIKNKLKNFKVNLIDQKVLLFIYDNNDIISTDVMVKADIISFLKFKGKEIFRLLVILLASLISIILGLVFENEGIKNISYSLTASSIAFIISEFIIKFSLRKEIEIKDFSKWVEKKDSISNMNSFFSDTNGLVTPKYEEEK